MIFTNSRVSSKSRFEEFTEKESLLIKRTSLWRFIPSPPAMYLTNGCYILIFDSYTFPEVRSLSNLEINSITPSKGQGSQFVKRQ